MRKIRANDVVRILVGRDRGKTGKVLSVLDEGKRVTVEKCNMVKRHKKPDQQYRAGGIIEKEAPLHISNVALAVEGGKPVRVSFQVQETEGGTKKVRYSKKLDRVLD